MPHFVFYDQIWCIHVIADHSANSTNSKHTKNVDASLHFLCTVIISEIANNNCTYNTWSTSHSHMQANTKRTQQKYKIFCCFIKCNWALPVFGFVVVTFSYCKLLYKNFAYMYEVYMVCIKHTRNMYVNRLCCLFSL